MAYGAGRPLTLNKGGTIRTLKSYIYQILETKETLPARLFNFSMTAIVVLGVVETVCQLLWAEQTSHMPVFHVIEVFSIAVYTTEYILRLWSSTANVNYSRPIVGRLRFALRPMLIIDLCAILPAFLPIVLPVNLHHLRLLKRLRIIRALKLGRYIRIIIGRKKYAPTRASNLL